MEAGGGTGNPGGAGVGVGNVGNNGSGGLLIIYANNLNNRNGIISSKGVTGGFGKSAAGGSSGGGSINIFYNQSCEPGDINANGGESMTGTDKRKWWSRRKWISIY